MCIRPASSRPVFRTWGSAREQDAFYWQGDLAMTSMLCNVAGAERRLVWGSRADESGVDSFLEARRWRRAGSSSAAPLLRTASLKRRGLCMELNVRNLRSGQDYLGRG